ncbi:hypothetical protein IV203_017293 [Nitzschia inconspicua]|uniref:Uncharacterized protein n=1 Tax=Nitzschia inconspicua TaxID=303405 RepID=A0A9K3KT83_9STRA|nr:hypothetical protein IV203_017293 [Nitzschia inconspicua]
MATNNTGLPDNRADNAVVVASAAATTILIPKPFSGDGNQLLVGGSDGRVSPRSVTEASPSPLRLPSKPNVTATSELLSREPSKSNHNAISLWSNPPLPVHNCVNHTRANVPLEWIQGDSTSCSINTLQNVYEASTAKMWQRIQTNRRRYPYIDFDRPAILQDDAVLETKGFVEEEEEDIERCDDETQEIERIGDAMDDAIFDLEL